MAYRLRLKTEAIDDMKKAFGWYESQREGLGTHFLNAVEAYLDSITRNPESFQKLGRQRFVVMRRFPFKIIFGIDFGIIFVYRVFHQSRNPGQLASHD